MKNPSFNRIEQGLSGEIVVPGDKSISHRSIMFGAIAEGTTVVENFLPGEDCLHTIDCFRMLGVEINQQENQVIVSGKGFEGLQNPKGVLDVGNSGTTIRLMLGLLAGLDLEFMITGDESIGKRPMKRVVDPLRLMGADITGKNDGNYTPLVLKGRKLKGIHYHSNVASAQVKSAILLAGLQAEGTTTVTEPHISRDHSERMLKYFGVDVCREGNSVSLQGGQKLRGQKIYVPSDISSGAFLMAAGLLVENSNITLPRVGLNPTRDGILDVIRKMNGNILVENIENEAFEPVGTVKVKSSNLTSTCIEGSVIPRLIDEIPILALMATQAQGKTVVKDAQELKVKETNRIDTVVYELSKMGANIEATEDGMIIYGPTKLKGAHVSSHGDHRIGMMLIVASMIAQGETIIEGIDAISVSYPNFLEDLEKLKRNE